MNCLLANSTTTINGQEMYLCLNCFVEFQAPTYAKYVFFSVTHLYECTFIKTSIIYTMIILFKYWGFSIGEIMNISLLNNPLLSWDRILDSKKCKKKCFKDYSTNIFTKYAK